jgi:GR25 family glycosyltransferase involved in LPS biosynthesis
MSINCIIISSKSELQRVDNVNQLKLNFETTIDIEAIYPKNLHIPFLSKLIHLSKSRTNKLLMASEIGVLLSHRKAWRYIIENEPNKDKHYLILESDSHINDSTILKNIYNQIEYNYDLFFWGAWEGNVSIYRSTQKLLQEHYKIGEPFMKSVYCTYGYSLNILAAKTLLKRTKKISYPVDLFKKFINRLDLRIGAVKPEIICNNNIFDSTVRDTSFIKKMKHKLVIKIFSLRNNLITYYN